MSHKILIVDDSALIRHSVRACIERNTQWEVCGEAENGRVAIEKVRQLHPDVVILDWQMPVMNGIDAAREITRIAPSATMLMITLHDSGELTVDAHAAGIKEVLSKTDGVANHLIASLNSVWAGN
jgi:two-component system, chemotaxis family, protein-glutamate methylesterase/glutaminase